MNKKLYFVFFILLLFSAVSVSSVNDPTAPLSVDSNNEIAEKEKDHTIILQSIFYGKSRRLAIINNQQFLEGDLIEGLLVKKIYQDYVLVRYAGKNTALHFSQQLVLDKS